MNSSLRLQQNEEQHSILRTGTFLPSVLLSEPPPQTWLKIINFTKIKSRQTPVFALTYKFCFNTFLRENTTNRCLSFWQHDKASVSNLKVPYISQVYTDYQKHAKESKVVINFSPFKCCMSAISHCTSYAKLGKPQWQCSSWSFCMIISTSQKKITLLQCVVLSYVRY